MNKPEPVTVLFVAEPGPEPGSEPVQLAGPLTARQVNAALERPLRVEGESELMPAFKNAGVKPRLARSRSGKR